MKKSSLILSGILLISTNVISGTNCYKTWDGSYSCKDSGSKYSTSVYKDRMNGGYESYDFNMVEIELEEDDQVTQVPDVITR